MSQNGNFTYTGFLLNKYLTLTSYVWEGDQVLSCLTVSATILLKFVSKVKVLCSTLLARWVFSAPGLEI